MSIEGAVYARGQGWVSASFAEALTANREANSLAWISLLEPSESDFEVIAGSLGLEPRLLKEAARFPYRSGVDRHDARLVAVLPTLQDWGEGDHGPVEIGGIGSVAIGWVLVVAMEEPNMIVTLTYADRLVLDELHRGVERCLDLLAIDSATVLLEVVGAVLEKYEAAVDAINERISEAEVSVMEGRSSDVVRHIHTYTSQAVRLQQAINPLASSLDQLVGDGGPVVHRQLSRLRHRALRVSEELDGAHQRLSSLLQVNLTVVGQKISAWGAILIVPSLIAGVFGMNFESAWWQKADHGFEMMLVIMFLVSGSLYVWFKRSGWL